MDSVTEAQLLAACSSTGQSSSYLPTSHIRACSRQLPNEWVAPSVTNDHNLIVPLHLQRPRGLGIISLPDIMQQDNDCMGLFQSQPAGIDSWWSDILWNNPGSGQGRRECEDAQWFGNNLPIFRSNAELSVQPHVPSNSTPPFKWLAQQSEKCVTPLVEPSIELSVEVPADKDKAPAKRPHACQIEKCDRRFTRRGDLARHKRSVSLRRMIIVDETNSLYQHCRERPYSCPLCKNTFTRKDTVRRCADSHDERCSIFTNLMALDIPLLRAQCCLDLGKTNQDLQIIANAGVKQGRQ